MPRNDVTFNEINQKIRTHLEERDWHNNPARGLVISIALEANELLEHYQWHDEPVGRKAELAEELADIFIYAFQFAQTHDIDIPEAITKKLEKAAKKYPAEHFKAKTQEERKKAWLKDKMKYQKSGL
ncbi:MazG nucleotide pyrophosphohydrolase [candidate division TM7 genomosp. GTL1]|nr:MazG nucleotide pyrophosphohydrolase [candidate division TM7 genomosp. GTL1]